MSFHAAAWRSWEAWIAIVATLTTGSLVSHATALTIKLLSWYSLVETPAKGLLVVQPCGAQGLHLVNPRGSGENVVSHHMPVMFALPAMLGDQGWGRNGPLVAIMADIDTKAGHAAVTFEQFSIKIKHLY
jgi:hypothetical protein